jgi:hypothetical protein
MCGLLPFVFFQDPPLISKAGKLLTTSKVLVKLL